MRLAEPNVWQVTPVLGTDWHAETRTVDGSFLAGSRSSLDIRLVNDKSGEAVVVAYGVGIDAKFASRKPGEIEITVPNDGPVTYYSPVVSGARIIMHFTPNDDPDRRVRYAFWLMHLTDEKSRIWFCKNVFPGPQWEGHAEERDKNLARSAYGDKGPFQNYCLNRPTD